jgi:microsomal dipeptidase-like Zn-dependent dipeptidase
MRRAALLVVVVPVGLALALVAMGENAERFANRVSGPPLPDVSEAAVRLHRSSFVVDLHADSLLWGRDLSQRSTVGHVDLPRLREGNVGLEIFTIVTRFPAGASIERTQTGGLDLIMLLALTNGWPWRTVGSLTDRALHQAHRLADVATRDPFLRIVRSRSDLDQLLAERATDPRWVGAILGLEGAHALDRPGALDEVFESGVRLIGLAHFFDNDYAGSAHGVAKGGLTERGRELVREMERRGIVVDLAHSSDATIRDVLAIARRPPIVSHTGLKGTCNNTRNLSDEQLRSVARAGGLVGIGDWPTAVCGDTPAAVARAIRYAVGVVGDEHVALGSDFDGAVTTPFDASRLDALTEAMLDADLPETSVRRVLGENAVGVLRKLLP